MSSKKKSGIVIGLFAAAIIPYLFFVFSLFSLGRPLYTSAISSNILDVDLDDFGNVVGPESASETTLYGGKDRREMILSGYKKYEKNCRKYSGIPIRQAFSFFPVLVTGVNKYFPGDGSVALTYEKKTIHMHISNDRTSVYRYIFIDGDRMVVMASNNKKLVADMVEILEDCDLSK